MVGWGKEKQEGEHMVLLVVDTQKGIVDERLYAFEKFVSNIKKLMQAMYPWTRH